MCKKMLFLGMFALVSVFTSGALATQVWDGGGVGDSWSTDENWSGDAVPGSGEDVYFGDWTTSSAGPSVVDGTAFGGTMYLGNRPEGGHSYLSVDGGSLALTGNIYIGMNTDAAGTLTVNSGSVTIDGATVVGEAGSGTIIMNGGTLSSVWQLFLGRVTGGTGHVQLDGGTMDIHSLTITSGTMDIAGGLLKMKWDYTTAINGYVTAGLVTAYGGDGTVIVDYDTETEYTMVTAIHPLNPNPANDDLNVDPAVTELCWTNPEPGTGGVITCDVYFGTGVPNEENPPSYGLPQIVLDEAVESKTVVLSAETTYYWKVDCFDSSTADPNAVMSGLFTFTTCDENAAPVVDAGEDVYAWLTGGTVDVTLAGVLVEDDGVPVAATTLWSIISQPDEVSYPATFTPEPPVNLDSVITMTALGEYVLQLEADDTDKTGTDTMTIGVYEDSCAAAKAVPGFELLDGDIDEDCDVDLDDFAALAGDWLESNFLD